MSYKPPEQLGTHEEQLKAAFAFGWKKGAEHGTQAEREECAKIADRKTIAAIEAEPCVEKPEATRARHFAIAAEQIGDAIRARGKENS